MNSETVYLVVKALSKEEQKLLLDKLKKDFSINLRLKKQGKKLILKRKEAITYLIQNVFRN